MDLDHRAAGIVEEDLVPCQREGRAIIDIAYTLGFKVSLERLDVIGPERDMAALQRIDRFASTDPPAPNASPISNIGRRP